MGWIPDEPEDAFWFVVSPITGVPTAVYAAAAYTTGDYPVGKPDWRANVRNAGIWGAIAVGVHAWNAIWHPGKYSFTTGSQAFKVAGHLAASPVSFAIAAATVSAVAWAATGDLHGAVPPGTGMGMPMTPDLYSGGSTSNPAGWDFGVWLDNLF